MGSRSDQFAGLNPWARALVAGTPQPVSEKGVRTSPDGSQTAFERSFTVSDVRAQESTEFYHGMFKDPYPLMVYLLPDGRRLQEFVQADPWSSGPVFFLALKENNEPLAASLWDEQAISEA